MSRGKNCTRGILGEVARARSIYTSLAAFALGGCGRIGFDPEDDRVATFGGAEADQPLAIAATASGNVVVAGRYRDAVDFGCASIVSAGGDDGFLVELTPELACVRAWTVGG